jgi:hypothetical protein
MPEQPSDPLHYEMKIPPEPTKKQGAQEKPAADQKKDESNSAQGQTSSGEMTSPRLPSGEVSENRQGERGQNKK